MGKYILRRLLLLIPVLIGVSIIVFFMIRLIPGDPADIMLGERGTEADRVRMREAMGLNKPMYEQYIIFVDHVLHGNLGNSLIYNRPAWPMIAQRFPRTLYLALYGIVLSALISLPLGMLSALKKDRLPDQAVRGGVTLFLSMPGFWIGVMLMLIFGVKLRVFPVGGFGNSFVENLKYLFLPALTIALAGSSVLVRNLRARILDVLQSDYVRTARAKGLSPRTIFVRHVLRNSLISTVTLLGLRVAYVIGGAAIIETVFALPGMGRFLLQSISYRDYPVVQAITLLFAVQVMVVNLVTDVLYAVVDPRVRYA